MVGRLLCSDDETFDAYFIIYFGDGCCMGMGEGDGLYVALCLMIQNVW